MLIKVAGKVNNLSSANQPPQQQPSLKRDKTSCKVHYDDAITYNKMSPARNHTGRCEVRDDDKNHPFIKLFVKKDRINRSIIYAPVAFTNCNL